MAAGLTERPRCHYPIVFLPTINRQRVGWAANVRRNSKIKHDSCSLSSTWQRGRGPRATLMGSVAHTSGMAADKTMPAANQDCSRCRRNLTLPNQHRLQKSQGRTSTGEANWKSTRYRLQIQRWQRDLRGNAQMPVLRRRLKTDFTWSQYRTLVRASTRDW